ncbi:hypothetical protein BIV25_28310 [Streptomyces sp. MUSC 14]|nr:hypothetical protein BIV25_28310 [Streptomyces sp. MUSC 14]
MQAVFLLRFTVAFLMGTGTAAPDPRTFVTGATARTLATVYVYAINGVHDAPEDRLNGTGRPIGRGEPPPHRARTVAHACAAPAVALKWRTSTTVAAVLLLGGLTSAGWTAAGGRTGALEVIVFGGALTPWMGMAGALVQDLSDVRGDTAAGRRTALVLRGERRARLVCALNPVALALAFLTTSVAVAPSLLPSAAAAACPTGRSADPVHRLPGPAHHRAEPRPRRVPRTEASRRYRSEGAVRGSSRQWRHQERDGWPIQGRVTEICVLCNVNPFVDPVSCRRATVWGLGAEPGTSDGTPGPGQGSVCTSVR